MTASKNETLSVGIVTYNHGRLIGSTIQSVLDGLPSGMPAEVWVLDNGSSDETVNVIERAAANDSRVRVQLSANNLGFGKGNNRILQTVKSHYHVLCNPDIAIAPDALEVLINFLREHRDVGIVCPRVHFENGELQALNRRHPTVLDLFLRRFIPQGLKHVFRRRMARYEMRDLGYDQSYDVPFVSGAFMVCRTAVLRDVGGFDPRYFLYFEDADLSRSVQQHGWRTMFCPEAEIVHGWQRDAHRNYRALLHFGVSAARYFNKWGWRFY